MNIFGKIRHFTVAKVVILIHFSLLSFIFSLNYRTFAPEKREFKV